MQNSSSGSPTKGFEAASVTILLHRKTAIKLQCPRASNFHLEASKMDKLRVILGLSCIGAAAWLIASRADDTARKTADGFTLAQQQFANKLLDSVKEYEKFGRVDDEYRWAPELCRMPNPGRAQVSASSDSDTHGKKLYSLFAKDRWAYVLQNGMGKPVAVGQVIVKESWVPEEVKDVVKKEILTKEHRKRKQGESYDFNNYDHFSPYATKDGKTFKASKKAGLFVMMKLDPKTPETDSGWVYGTTDTDLKTVTAVGKIASCMECHQKAKNDRLFGLKER